MGRRLSRLLFGLRSVSLGVLPARLLSVPVRVERDGRRDGGFPPRAAQGVRADRRGAQPPGFHRLRRALLGARGPAPLHREPALIRVVRHDAQAKDAKAAQDQRNRLRPVLVLLVPVRG